MGLFDLSLLYAIVRSVVAAILGVAVYRYSRASGFVVAQAASDACCALFIVAYVSAPLRAGLHGWVILMFLYSAGWEAMMLARRLIRFLPFVAADSAEEEASPLTALSNFRALAWSLFAVAPAIAAGFFLTLNAAAPGNWLFPGQPHSSVSWTVRSFEQPRIARTVALT
jgi:hypothetical protein